jgi:hypothetical protein
MFRRLAVWRVAGSNLAIDPQERGPPMSTLVFDGLAHTLTLFNSQNRQVGQWHANNVVDHRATMRFVPNGSHAIIDQTRPHTHGDDSDTLNGAYGRFGIIRMEEFTANNQSHTGVGIHSGRANRGGADHATMGCIRTTDEAMEAISRQMRNDPITSITVEHNHDQHNRYPLHHGDHHHRHHHHRQHTQPAPQGSPGGTPGNTPMT